MAIQERLYTVQEFEAEISTYPEFGRYSTSHERHLNLLRCEFRKFNQFFIV